MSPSAKPTSEKPTVRLHRSSRHLAKKSAADPLATAEIEPSAAGEVALEEAREDDPVGDGSAPRTDEEHLEHGES